jgi:hypothetical protein
MITVSLPVELLYIVLLQLAAPLLSDDKTSKDQASLTRRDLASCTLVSRTWRDVGQSLLFQKLELMLQSKYGLS